MKFRFYSKLRDLAYFFITPLTLVDLKQWKFYVVYSIAIIPAIILTYNTADRFLKEYIHDVRLNERMLLTSRKKNDELLDFKSHYRDFVKIAKQDSCLKHLSIAEAEKNTNNKWIACINKIPLNQRVKNFISEKHDTLDGYYNPVNTFKKIAEITNKTLTSPVKYTALTPTTQDIYTVLPVEFKFSSSFEETLKYMREINGSCSNCQVSIHKLNKTTKNNYRIVLMVRLNLEMPDRESEKKLSQYVSSGVFSGNNLSNFVKEKHQLLQNI